MDGINQIIGFLVSDCYTSPSVVSLELGFWAYFIASFGGIVAGFLTTLAGLGSAITLYILMYIIGLPPNMANATNRVGILAMAMTALPTFRQKGHLNLRRTWPILICLITGAMIGVLLALRIDNDQFRQVFKYLFIFLCMITLINPKKWLRATSEIRKLNWWWLIPIFLLLGIYAGFIQMGSGIVILVLLVLGLKMSLLDANGIKLASVFIYTLLVIGVFASQGYIHWGIALALGIGEAAGAALAARFATSHPNATLYMHRVLIFVVISGTLWMFRNEIYYLFV